MKKNVNIKVIADVICPWCFICKRRLDRALASEVGEGVALRWRPFMLYPNAPKEGWDRFEFLQRRYGGDCRKNAVMEKNAVTSVSPSRKKTLARDNK